MKRRWVSILLTVTLLLGAVAIGVTPAAADEVTVTVYGQAAVAANLTPVSRNLLTDATAQYRSGAQGTAQSSSTLTTVLTDGQYAHDNSAKLCPSGEYVYFFYDLGTSHTVTSLVYAGDYNDGAASVAVYVGQDAPDTFLRQERYAAVYDDSCVGISVRVPAEKNKGVSAVRFDFSQPLTGRYVVFRLQGYWNDGNYQTWVSEFSAEGSEVLTMFQTQGAQLRGYVGGTPTGNQDVRFGTTLAVTGVTADEQHNTILSADSRVTVNGTAYPVTDFGTLVARADRLGDTPLQMEQAGDVVKVVPARKLYDVGTDSVTYTAVVTDIPEGHYDTPLVVRGYVQYRDGDTLRCAYGAVVQRSARDVIRKVAPTAQDKLVALTFDDGPSPATTQRLLDALKERDVHATFFLKGTNITADTAYLVERMAAEGHAIGNHTENHQHLTAMSAAQMKSEVDTCAAKIEDIVGYSPRILRCPGGWVNEDVQAFAAGEGLMLINWSLDTRDWESRNADAILQKAFDSQSGIRDGSIVLMHDTYPTTVDAAIEMVDRLLEQGYALVTVPQLLELRCAGGTAGMVYTGPYLP